MGPKLFAQVALAYLEKHPSRSHTLSDWGQRFADFLQDHSILRDHPYLTDLAKLDWAEVESFYASEESSPKESEAPITTFRKPSHVQWLSSTWGIFEVTQSNPFPQLKEATGVVYRSPNDLFSYNFELAFDEARLLRRLHDGVDLADALSRYVEEKGPNQLVTSETISATFCDWSQKELLLPRLE